MRVTNWPIWLWKDKDCNFVTDAWLSFRTRLSSAQKMTTNSAKLVWSKNLQISLVMSHSSRNWMIKVNTYLIYYLGIWRVFRGLQWHRLNIPRISAARARLRWVRIIVRGMGRWIRWGIRRWRRFWLICLRINITSLFAYLIWIK